MQTCTEYVTLAYSESSFALSFSGRAGTPFGQTSPCLLFRTYFFSFCQSCSLRLFTGTNPEFRGIAQRPSVVRSTFRCLVSLTLRLPGRTPSHTHPLCTPRASPFAHQRFLWCVRGRYSTLREFVYRHSSCLLTKRGSRQYTCCPKRTNLSNMSLVHHANPGVPNSPFQGLSKYTPHTPPFGTVSGHK